MWFGAVGFIFVIFPAVVGLKYNTSPSAHVSPCKLPVVFISFTCPPVVINPSWLLAIVSVTTPKVVAEFKSLFACAKSTDNLWPVAPIIFTTW